MNYTVQVSGFEADGSFKLRVYDVRALTKDGAEKAAKSTAQGEGLADVKSEGCWPREAFPVVCGRGA